MLSESEFVAAERIFGHFIFEAKLTNACGQVGCPNYHTPRLRINATTEVLPQPLTDLITLHEWQELVRKLEAAYAGQNARRDETMDSTPHACNRILTTHTVWVVTCERWLIVPVLAVLLRAHAHVCSYLCRVS
jgi:hypothetical protein